MPTPITDAEWRVVRRVFQEGFASSLHFAVASVREDGGPRVTPIGSLLLGEAGHGLYFEAYAVGLQRDLARNPRVCVMALSITRWQMLRALLLGRASRPFGVRLHGTAGERREATPEERERFLRRVRRFRFLRGHGLLWGKLRTVRDVRFDAIEPVRVPPLGDPWPAVVGP
jgi:pyridoxamine 5'-phosphate oxidase-like protein